MRWRLAALYWALAAIGTLLPLAAFLPWLMIHGIDLPLFARELFANRISSFFAFDVLVSAFVVALFAIAEGGRARVKGRWWAIAATFCIGISSGLPLFLALREMARRSPA